MVSDATVEQVAAAWDDPKLANVLYHDWEASTYDEKWSISYDQRCIDYARDRFVHVVGEGAGGTGSEGGSWPYAKALELGCGTGFFLLNLKQAGVLEHGLVTDISPGMVAAARRNAESLGFEVEGRVADAESMPYPDDTFDLVVGHAVLHHIPDVDQALREVLRVLKPGGRFVFAGEPTKHGDFVARRLSRLTWFAATRLVRTCRCCASGGPDRAPSSTASSQAAALESVVDVHTFDPDELASDCRGRRCGRRPTVTEELTAVVVRLAGPDVRVRREPRNASAGAGRCSPTTAGCGCPRWTRTSSRTWCRRRSSTTCA